MLQTTRGKQWQANFILQQQVCWHTLYATTGGLDGADFKRAALPWNDLAPWIITRFLATLSRMGWFEGPSVWDPPAFNSRNAYCTREWALRRWMLKRPVDFDDDAAAAAFESTAVRGAGGLIDGALDPCTGAAAFENDLARLRRHEAFSGPHRSIVRGRTLPSKRCYSQFCAAEPRGG